MALQRKVVSSAVATLILLLLFCQKHVHARNTAASGSDPSVVAVHVLEKYAPFATAYQIGTYKSQDGWSLIFSFKAHAPSSSSTNRSSCFEALSASGVDGSGSTSGQAKSQVLKRIIVARSTEVKKAFCVVERDESGSDASKVVSYSENSTSLTSLVRTTAPVPDMANHILLFRFEALEVQQWRQFKDLEIVSDVVIQRIKSPRFGVCGTHLKVQWDNFNFNITGFPALHLCVRTVTRSAHELWTRDDQEQYISNVELVELPCKDDFSKACPRDYTPAVYDLVDMDFKDKIARLDLSSESCFALCYARSPLVVDVNAVASGNFIKRIRFDQTTDPHNRVVVEYSNDDTALWHDTNRLDGEVNAW